MATSAARSWPPSSSCNATAELGIGSRDQLSFAGPTTRAPAIRARPSRPQRPPLAILRTAPSTSRTSRSTSVDRSLARRPIGREGRSRRVLRAMPPRLAVCSMWPDYPSIPSRALFVEWRPVSIRALASVNTDEPLPEHAPTVHRFWVPAPGDPDETVPRHPRRRDWRPERERLPRLDRRPLRLRRIFPGAEAPLLAPLWDRAMLSRATQTCSIDPGWVA